MKTLIQGVLVLVLIHSTLARAQAENAERVEGSAKNSQKITQIDQRIHQFDLPGEDLASSLVKLALQSGISIVADYDKIEGYRSSPVVGSWSTRQALKQLLARVPFDFKFDTDSKSVFIIPKAIVSLPSSAPKNEKVTKRFEEEVIVTASGFRIPLYKAPAIASVITAEEIEKRGARSLNEALEMVPGLHVSPSAISRLDSVYSIRGIHTGFNPETLFMINGTPITTSFQGSRPVSFRLPTTNIEQIEVIRGPGSAIYGADAYSGVINVITKGSTVESDNSIGFRAGSFNTREFWSYGSNTIKGWDADISFTYQRSDGDEGRRVSSDQQTQLDAIFNTSASFAPGSLSTNYEIFDSYLSLKKNRWSLNFWGWVSNNSGLGAGAIQALDPNGGDNSNLFLTDIRYQIGDKTEIWDNSIKTTYFYYDTEVVLNILPPGAKAPIGIDGNLDFSPASPIVEFPDGLIGNPGGTTEDYSIEFVSQYSGLDNHRLRIATGVKHQTIDTRERKNFGPGVIDGSQAIVDGRMTDVSDSPFVYLSDISRNNLYLSLQDVWRLTSELELTTGIRYDHYTDFGSTTNPRVALVWEATSNITAKLLSGRAYRAPSFAEQFYDNNPVLIGNSNLDPEEIITHEIALTISANRNVTSTFSVFNYQAKGMIEFLLDDGGTKMTAQNARDQDGMGMEWELSWRPVETLQVQTSFSLQDSKDSTTGHKIEDAPRQHATMNINWEPTEQLQIGVQVNHVADRARKESDNRPAIKDYTLVDVSMRYQDIFPNVDLSLGIRNAGDEDAREPSNGIIAEDFPLESRNYQFGVSYRFK